MIYAPFTTLGPIDAGEITEAWICPWVDFDGAPLDLAAYNGTATWQVGSGVQVTRVVTCGVDSTTLVWQEGDFATPGLLHGVVTITNGVLRFKRVFKRVINPSTLVTVITP